MLRLFVSNLRMRSAKIPIAIAAMAAIVAMLLPASASAVNRNFCTNSYLAPYGHGGDRCLATYGNYLYDTNLVTHERAGCIDVTYNGTLLEPWTCGAAGSSPASAVVLWFVGDEWKIRQPIIRNNNLSYSAHFDGAYQCVMECG